MSFCAVAACVYLLQQHEGYDQPCTECVLLGVGHNVLELLQAEKTVCLQVR